jgi:hypothetical protein
MCSCTKNSYKNKNKSIPKVVDRKKLLKIREEVNELETKIKAQQINETKSWFFEKINKVNIPLAKLTKRKKEKIQNNKIRDEIGDITDTKKIQKIVQEYFKTYIKQTGKSRRNR